MRILINQTTRMGDMIQTGPLVSQLRLQHPDAHIAVMVRRMGRIIGERHPDVNEVIVYNEDDLFLDLRSGDSDRLLTAYRRAETFIRGLHEKQFDVIYNVTHSQASAMLARLAEIPKVVGADMTDDWQFLLRSRWANYFFTSVFNRDYNDLNLCDITRHFAADAPPCPRLSFTLTDEDRAFAAQVWQDNGIAEGDCVVCFQLGASELNKRWPEARFAALAQRLHAEHNARILLLGVDEEAPLGENFEKLAPGRAVPLFGKTTVPQAVALLERARLLVTNDTGTMHLAATVDCPIVLISVGHVHFRETGPYGADHIAIEPRRQTLGRSDFVPNAADDRERITADHAYAAAKLVWQYRETGRHDALDAAEALADVDFYRTAFAPDGNLEFYPILRRPMGERDFLRTAYRAMWLEHLNEKHDRRIETESLTRTLACYDGPDDATRDRWTREQGAAFKALAALAKRGADDTEALLTVLRKGAGMAKAKTLVAQLMALDEEMRVHSEVHPACRPLIYMARFERDNLEGADPIHLARTTLDIYRACYARARLMEKKLRRVQALGASGGGNDA